MPLIFQQVTNDIIYFRAHQSNVGITRNSNHSSQQNSNGHSRIEGKRLTSIPDVSTSGAHIPYKVNIVYNSTQSGLMKIFLKCTSDFPGPKGASGAYDGALYKYETLCLFGTIDDSSRSC